MKNNLLKKIEKLEKLHKQRRWWYRLVSAMACVVVFCTVYALILPAITMEGEPSCKMAEHQHEESCYKVIEPVRQFVCDEKPHEHTKKCYDSEKNLICGYADFYIHTHTDECYQNGKLICPLKEIKEHKHTSECYKTITKSVCEKKETKGHTHTDKCYTENKTLICGQEESEGHKHEESCYDENGQLICGKEESEGHTHNDNCYKVETELTCGKEESEGHKHTKDCAVKVKEKLTCKKDEIIPHEHTKKCWDKDGKLICDKVEIKEHKHTDECIQVVKEATKKLICGKKEHVHTEDCYSEAKAIAEEDEATGTVEEITTGETEETTTASEVEETTAAESDESTTTAVSEETTTAGSEETTTSIADETTTAQTEETTTAAEEATTAISEEPDIITDEIQYICGKEAHQHTEECYDEKGNLICTLEEHIHTEECYPPEEVQENEPVTLEASNATMTVIATYQPGVFPDETTMVLESDSLDAVEQKSWDNYLETLTADGQNTAVLTQSFGVDFQDVEGVSLVPSGEIEFAVKYNEPLQAETEIEPAVKEIEKEDTKAKDTKAKTAAEEAPKEETKVEWILAEYTPDSETAIQQMDVVEMSINEENQVEELSFASEAPTQYGVVMVAARAAGVSSEAALREAIANASANGQETVIQLDGGFSVGGDILNIATGKNITLDLYGYVLTTEGNKSLFEIQTGATLTVMDSQKDNVTRPVSKEFTYSLIKPAESQNHTVQARGAIKSGERTTFEVAGGTLNLESGMICDGFNRVINMSGGTVNLNGGYICGFKKDGDVTTGDNNFGGAVLATGGTINIGDEKNGIPGSVIAGNEALNGGAIYAKNTIINIAGGIISGNKSTRNSTNWGDHSEGAPYRCGGGGIFLDGASELTMDGGYITNNTAADEGYFDGGGGVLISGASTFTLNGGYITGNEAAGGGGVRSDWNKGTTFTMNGGYISGNTARSAEGGGIAITQGGVGYIRGGYITNNVTNSKSHWGGGGLFCSDGAYIYMWDANITSNNAGGFGGGVAGCSTGRVYVCVKDGGAIYNNSAEGVHLSGGGSQKNEDHTYAASSPVFMENGYEDYFCALNSVVEGGMLGGGTANWSGSKDGEALSNVPKEAILEAAYVMGLTAYPSDTDIAKAQSAAKVFINGNSSYTHGGGVLCNGYLLIGDKNPIAVGSRFSLSGTKRLKEEEKNIPLGDYVFKFSVKDKDGNVVSSGTSDKDGNITFDRLLSFSEELCKTKIHAAGEKAIFVYYLTEDAQQENLDITIDSTQYKISVEITREDQTLPLVDANGNPIVRAYYKITSVDVDKSTDGGTTWENVGYTWTPSNDEQHAGSLKITNDVTFTNQKKETISLAVKKEWHGEGDHPKSITVKLLRDGEVIDTIKLSGENNWSHTWDNLAKGPKYTVEEISVPGYDTEITYGGNDTETVNGWVLADTIKLGEKYLIVDCDNMALTGNTGGGAYDFTNQNFTKVSISDNMISVSDVKESMQWEAVEISGESGIYLQNKASAKGNYLAYHDVSLIKSANSGYASPVVPDCSNGLKLHNYKDTDIKKYVIKQDGKLKADDGNTNAVKLYKLVGNGSSEEDITVTITNTRNEEAPKFYDLDIKKVGALDATKTLEGAEFQLLMDETPLTFSRVDENSPYVYDTDGGITNLVTGSDGMIHITGLPAGNYILKETKAPNGYELAEDKEISLGGDGATTVEITVVDKEIQYNLPETGGAGTFWYYIGGLLAILISVLYSLNLISKKQKR